VQIYPDSRIYVAAHRGLVGSAVVREFFDRERPDAAILAAARVGGIHANNSRPAMFIRDNLLIRDNVIDAAYRSGVGKFVFLGSSSFIRNSRLS
jgi:GDP-L-fucose synthase